MRPSTIVPTLALAASSLLPAQPWPWLDDWIGIWQAHAAGVPGGTMTDTSQLGGTVVLDMIRGEGGRPHGIESEPHVQMNLHADLGRLWFQVRMKWPDGGIVIASLEVTRIDSDKAAFHCTSCGTGAPDAVLIRHL
jgi:hypothetical protein